MRNLFSLFTITIFFLSCNIVDKKPIAETTAVEEIVTTYYLIRHAEKDRSDPDNGDPNLTEAGLQRAKNWATFFTNVDLDQIYSTNYNRTQQTARFVAEQKGITIQSYNPSKLYSEDFQQLTQGGTVLVVGHSNTTPQFVNAIIGEEKYTDMDDGDNSSVYVVTVTGTKKSVQVLTVD